MKSAGGLRTFSFFCLRTRLFGGSRRRRQRRRRRYQWQWRWQRGFCWSADVDRGNGRAARPCTFGAVFPGMLLPSGCRRCCCLIAFPTPGGSAASDWLAALREKPQQRPPIDLQRRFYIRAPGGDEFVVFVLFVCRTAKRR